MFKIDVTFDGKLRFKEVFEGIIFENQEGEQIEIRMKNGGFEILKGMDSEIEVIDAS